MNGVDINQLRYVMYLDACNISSDYSSFVINNGFLLFVLDTIATIAVAIILHRYLCSLRIIHDVLE